MHSQILPNHLTIFYNKLVQHFLPFHRKFSLFILDAPKTMGCFCNNGPDLAEHIFISWEKVKPIWLYVQKLIFITTAIALPVIENHVPTNYKSPNSSDDQQAQAVVSFLISVTNHKIWIFRNNKIYENIVTGPCHIIDQIKNSICKRYESKR